LGQGRLGFFHRPGRHSQGATLLQKYRLELTVEVGYNLPVEICYMRFPQMAKSATPMDALVGARLRSRRKQLKMSQERLGKDIGVSFQQVQKYENGTNRIGAGRLAEISNVLDVPVAYFFTGNSAGGSSDSEKADARAILSEPGATELLQAYAQIGSLALRNAVVRLARDLAGNYADGRPAAKRPHARNGERLSKASP